MWRPSVVLAMVSVPAVAGCARVYPVTEDRNASLAWLLPDLRDSLPPGIRREVQASVDYGLAGSSPTLRLRVAGERVQGEAWVWYPRVTLPADSSDVASARERRSELHRRYGCVEELTSVYEVACRLRYARGEPDWAAALVRLDSLAATEPPAQRVPPRQESVAVDSVTGLPADRINQCLDGGGWGVEWRDSSGYRTLEAAPDCWAQRAERTAWDQAVKELLESLLPAERSAAQAHPNS